ncbi:unnamed protein product [Angiostrongylus costaricensis]|uniref:3-hydroxyisobutyryl-CoA hydrolase, mitochondrial n=1 Tax=Angiostrongylus costaricensis TaxID=334426 RepID=A0A158PEV0_ANGCS|nr:unnamed protein product [Angiostrongylus costaricensis]
MSDGGEYLEIRDNRSRIQETCRMAMSTSISEIIVQEEGSKRILTLNRPKALNALNLSMVREIYPRFKKWEDGGDVSMIILKGSGEKAFCAGGDVLAVTRSAKEAASGGTSTTHKDFFREEYRLNHLIGSLSKTFVAFIDGIVMGGDNLGLYLALTGYRLHGADCYHAGLATHYVTSSRLKDLQNKLLTMERVTYNEVDGVIREFQPSNIPTFSLEEHLPVIKKTFYARSVEEIFENLRVENSEWSKQQLKTLSKMSPTSLKVTFKQLENGAKMKFGEVKTDQIAEKCTEGRMKYENPANDAESICVMVSGSTRVTYDSFFSQRKGRRRFIAAVNKNYASSQVCQHTIRIDYDLFKVFTMEYRLAQRFLKDHDFYEGCRAILIDKDRNPKWIPERLEDVTDAVVERYFDPLGQEDLIFDG